MKDEISQLINNVVDTSTLSHTLNPEWCAVMRSDVELCHLQSSYEELYKRHMEVPHEVTPDIHAKLIERYGLLHNSYVGLVKDHAALKDDLERFMRQVTKPAAVRDGMTGCFSLGELTIL